jgi:putative ABC transport system permease protein
MKSLVASLRSLRRAPAFSVLVILTLALGIGATTAMFSVVDNVLINPIPFPHADRVTDLSMRYEEGASRAPAATATVIATLREQQDLFDVVGAFQYGAGTLTGAGDPEMLSFPQLSANIFSIFPVAPIAGRLFTPADATASERVLLLAEPFWIARFGSDPRCVARGRHRRSEDARASAAGRDAQRRRDQAAGR